MDLCQYCGANLEGNDPELEVGYLYGVECSRCPEGKRHSHMLARASLVHELTCPDCGARLAPPDAHPDVLVIKQMTYELCPECGTRCGVAAVRKLRDVAHGTM